MKELKRRMNSIGTITKITKSSKMIAAAKFRQAEQAVLPVRPIISTFYRFWGAVYPKQIQFKVDEGFFKLPEGETSFGNILLVPITADRGLCGAVNSSITRVVRKHVDEIPDFTQVLVGDRARSALFRAFPTKTYMAFGGTSKIVPITSGIAIAAAQACAQVKYDYIFYIWNYYKNAMTYYTYVTRFPSFQKMIETGRANVDQYEIEGNDLETLENFHEFSHAMMVYYFLVEQGATEQSQRMTAMDASTKNANELITKLKLRYNRLRQGKITTELIEIISGAAALD